MVLKIQLLSTAGGKVIFSTKGVKSIQVKVCVLFTRLLVTSKHRFVGVENTIVVKGVKSKVLGFALTYLFVVVNIKHEIVESSSVGTAIIRWKGVALIRNVSVRLLCIHSTHICSFTPSSIFEGEGWDHLLVLF